jgi:hypothetical protein
MPRARAEGFGVAFSLAGPRRSAKRACWFFAGMTLTAVLAPSSPALAYPSAVIFAPSGEARAIGSIAVFAYEGLILRTKPGTSPFLSPWAGFQVGVLPAWDLGKSKYGFGGLELGCDVLTYAGTAKPIFNAKLGLLRGEGWVPSIGLGSIGWSPTIPRYSNNILYGAATLAPHIASVSLGRLHAGLGAALTDDRTVAAGTWPFDRGSGGIVLAGYESPSLGPAYLAVDHFGGFSDFGSTNFALGLVPIEHVSLILGWTQSNIRDQPFDGPFGMLTVDWQLFNAGRTKESGTDSASLP